MVNVSGENETKYYYHANNIYSVAALTKQNGSVQIRYAYDAYGRKTWYGTDVGNRYFFTGRRYDTCNDFYYYRARYYHPSLGRFLGRDPIGYEGKDFNLYRYVGDNPLIRTDPTGLRIGYDDNCSCKLKMGDVADKANKALQSKKCQDWFKDHGFKGNPGDTPGGYVRCHSNWKLPCALGFPAWTMPGSDIGLCNSALASEGEDYLASLLIHELAHHYCGMGSGREDCAISAQNACQIP